MLVFVFIAMLVSSCSNLKFLAEDEKLYTYTWFSEKGFGKIKDKPLKAYELYSVGKVNTNRPFIGLPRTNLLIYNYCKPAGTWGPRHYIYKVWAKPPVLLEDVNPEFRLKVMEQRLHEMGHFDSQIDLDLTFYGKDKKKARAKYNIDFYPAYTFRDYQFIAGGSEVDQLINNSLENSLIEKGDWYWANTLQRERNRISDFLRDKGYYFFNPDYLHFYADTTNTGKKVDMSLLLKSNIQEKSLQQYKIGDVTIKVNTDNPKHTGASINEPVVVGNLLYDDPWNFFNPKRIARGVSLAPGNPYSLTDQVNTIRFLQGYDAFKSVNVTYNRQDTVSNTLNATVELLPLKPLQTGINVTFATKSNDFLGPAAELTVAHLNMFKGAEKLILKVNGGFEWQKRSKRKEYELGFNSYELGSQLQLVSPRVLVPFRTPRKSMRYVSKTNATLGYRSLRRVQYYTLDVAQVKFGYNWRITDNAEYSLDLFSVDYLRVPDKSTAFQNFLDYFPQIAKSFEEQIIPGSIFTYTYQSTPGKGVMNQFYVSTMVDIAGNLVSLFKPGSGNVNDPDFNPGRIFATPYAQYFKWNGDLRFYKHLTEKQVFAARIFAGFGVPYGNSSVLPFSKQYFAGGSQDIRAFYARSVGPGSYAPAKNDILQGGFIDQTGDIKLLANFEYRFPITYRTNGAFFIDAGNVWLWNKDEQRPGGEFQLNRFMNEMAVGSGFGIRIDVDYFIFRFDASIPLRKPYIPGKEKWIVHNKGFFKDYILSLAIGYPF